MRPVCRYVTTSLVKHQPRKAAVVDDHCAKCLLAAQCILAAQCEFLGILVIIGIAYWPSLRRLVPNTCFETGGQVRIARQVVGGGFGGACS